MSFLKSRWAAIFFGIFLVIALDRVFGFFFYSLPQHLNRKIYSWDSYPSNPNGYFRHQGFGPDGKRYFFISRDNDAQTPQRPTLLAIGDSFTFGQGVYPEDTWPSKTAKSLGGVPILNLGRSGSNVEDVLRQVKSTLAKPQWIVYGFVLNDTIFTEPKNLGRLLISPPRPNREDAPFHWDLINIRPNEIRASRSRLFGILGQWSNIIDYALGIGELRSASAATIEFYRDLHDPKKNSTGLAKTWNAIKSMQKEAKERDAQFLVLIFPVFFQTESNYPFSEAHKVISTELTRRGISTIDLLPIFLGKPASKFWVHPLDQHPNHIAHAEIARVLSAHIEARRQKSKSR